MKGELANLDATEQAELVRRKEVSPLELVDAAITLPRRNELTGVSAKTSSHPAEHRIGRPRFPHP
jgi:hypothetical protein